MSTLYFFVGASGQNLSEKVSKDKPTADGVAILTQYNKVVPCIKAEGKPLARAAKERYGFNVDTNTEVPERISLKTGDIIIEAYAEGLPALGEGQKEYAEEEIYSATFSFVSYRILD